MKKLLLSLLLAFLYLSSILCSTQPCPPLTAKAESFSAPSYACVLQENTYLYATKNNQSELFVLPQTYYVKILSAASDFCKVEYLTDGVSTRKITGYCKTSQLTFVDYIPQAPYFYYVFDLTYYIDSDSKDSPLLNQITLPCAYYGSYVIGSKTYCYVYRNGEFGYVPLPDDFSFTPNTEYAEYTQSQQPPQTDENNSTEEPKSTVPPTQIALIVLLCLLVPLLAAFVLRPPKKSVYDWEET